MGRAGFEPAALGLKVPQKREEVRCFKTVGVPSTQAISCSLDSRAIRKICPTKCPARGSLSGMPANPKLTDQQVKQIRRRVDAGERQTDLAEEFGVNRKTIRRRLDALEQVETERAEITAARQARRLAEREQQKLRELESGAEPSRQDGRRRRDGPRAPQRVGKEGSYVDWLDSRKNLSGRARIEARGLVRVTNPDGTVTHWRERAEIEALLEKGWRLA
jgi:hypothetical protein